MHPASGDKPQWSGCWSVVAQVNLNIMIASHTLVLAASESVQVFSVESAHEGGDVPAIVVDRADYLMGCFNRGNGKLCRWNHKALVHKNIGPKRVIDHHEGEVIVVIGLP